MRLRQFQVWSTLSLCFSLTAAAQAPIQPVQWKGSIAAKARIEPGHKATIDIAGNIQEGWHVYGLDQVAGGPTPLHAALEPNEIVQTAGAITSSAPVKKHDSSFDLDTQVYSNSFTLHVPVQVKEHPAAGKQALSVSVHYQACSDKVCLPPRTVHVSVPIEISPGL